MNDLTATKKQPVLSAGKIAGALVKICIALVLGVFAVVLQTAVFYGIFVVYFVYLIVSFFSFIKKCVGKSGGRPDTDEQKNQPDFVSTFNSFIGKHIDEILVSMPPPKNSVKYAGSPLICYYWTIPYQTIPGGGTLALFVDSQTSRVVKWTRTKY
jgi:hypothetical protein